MWTSKRHYLYQEQSAPPETPKISRTFLPAFSLPCFWLQWYCSPVIPERTLSVFHLRERVSQGTLFVFTGRGRNRLAEKSVDHWDLLGGLQSEYDHIGYYLGNLNCLRVQGLPVPSVICWSRRYHTTHCCFGQVTDVFIRRWFSTRNLQFFHRSFIPILSKVIALLHESSSTINNPTQMPEYNTELTTKIRWFPRYLP